MNRRKFFAALFAVPVAAMAVAKSRLRPAPNASENSANIRMTRAFEPFTNQFTSRMDVLYGLGSLQPEYAVRILG